MCGCDVGGRHQLDVALSAVGEIVCVHNLLGSDVGSDAACCIIEPGAKTADGRRVQAVAFALAAAVDGEVGRETRGCDAGGWCSEPVTSGTRALAVAASSAAAFDVEGAREGEDQGAGGVWAQGALTAARDAGDSHGEGAAIERSDLFALKPQLDAIAVATATTIQQAPTGEDGWEAHRQGEQQHGQRLDVAPHVEPAHDTTAQNNAGQQSTRSR